MQSVNRIITAKDYATREGTPSVVARIQKLAQIIRQRGGPLLIISPEPRGFAALACIEFGQWIAHCSCGGAELVDPDEPVFYCFGCGNRENGGYMRPVIFPSNREIIEALVLERPVDDSRGLDDLDRAYQSKPLLFAQVQQPDGSLASLPLSRSWTPNETVEDLRGQNAAVYAWRESLAEGGH